MSVYRHEIYGDATIRVAETNKDRQMINMMPLMLDQERKLYCLDKRPGLALDSAKGAAEGRGAVSAEGSLYYVIGNTIYKDGVALATTLDTSTGPIYMDKTQGAAPKVILQDKSDLYSVDTTDDTVYKIADADLPTTGFADGLVYLDGYVFIMTPDGKIYNSQLNPSLDNTDTDDWQATFFIQGQVVADGGMGLSRHVNYVIAFGKESAEVYYNAGESESPLLPFQGAASLIGLAAGNTIANIDQTLVWVACTKAGGRAVFLMEGFTPKKISNPAVEMSLEEEGSALETAYGYHIRAMGHTLYCLNITGVTWVFDLTTQKWHQWDTGGGVFNCGATIGHSNLTYVLGRTDGNVYTLDNETYQDNGQDITCTIQTEDFSGDTYQNKFLHRLSIVSDLYSTGSLSIQWSDDDYTTFNTARTISLSTRDFLTRCGYFQRRAFKLIHTANTPLRVYALEMSIRRGHYGR